MKFNIQPSKNALILKWNNAFEVVEDESGRKTIRSGLKRSSRQGRQLPKELLYKAGYHPQQGETIQEYWVNERHRFSMFEPQFILMSKLAICYQGLIYLNDFIFPWPPTRMSLENWCIPKNNVAHLIISFVVQWPLKQLPVLSSSKYICSGAEMKQIVSTLCVQRKLMS